MAKMHQCDGCGHDDRPIFQATSPISEGSYSFRLLCRYCLDRLREYPKAEDSNQWPYTLVMHIDAPKAWREKAEARSAAPAAWEGEGE